MATTSSGKRIPALTSSVYTSRERRPKWNVLVSPSMDPNEGGRMLRRRLPSWTKQDHMDAAEYHHYMREKKDAMWTNLRYHIHVDTFGKAPGFTDYKIAGIGRDEYPEDAKDELRRLAHDSSTHGSLALAHATTKHLRNWSNR